ncbi:hypothetical protein ACJRO7_006299 [Eucalyptus globulus]|uniref:Sec20 C-terminal domain-containing protein n=1 Tax=Eucalyptus globulus TaxID=34317 RepID=A0ABD3IH92_EUCGL
MVRHHRSCSPTPKCYRRQKSRNSSLAPTHSSSNPSLGSVECKSANEKLRKEEEERKRMDKVVEAVEEVKKEWGEAYVKTQEHIKAIEEYGKSREEKNSLPRLNGLAQDGLALLNLLQFKLDLLAPQLPAVDSVESAKSLLESWKTKSQNLRMRLRNANLQARANLKKAAQEERELLLGGGEESTNRRRNLQTKAGMTSAAENITESLRRTRQLMVQEVERSANTLMTVEDSTGVLRKAESEYKGHRSLLMRTRSLLSTMGHQDVIDRGRLQLR